jgi:hypothetical protein
MRVKVFLFAAITAALALPLWARGQRLEKTPVDPETEEVKGGAAPRQPQYAGYGFAPSLEPNAKRWKKQWRADRRLARELTKRDANAVSAKVTNAKGNQAGQLAQNRSADEMPPYWSFAEPEFTPPWLTQTIPVAVDAPRF